MRRNPLQDPRAALRFAVEFAQFDLASLSPRKLIAAELLVQAFINREKRISEHRIDGELGVKVLRAMQGRMFEILSTIAATPGPTKGHLTITSDLLLSFWGFRDGTRVYLEVMGSPLDRCEYQLMRVLEAVGLENLKVCSSVRADGSECGRLFVKVTKKEFCSARCQSRTYMQKYRADERAEKEKVERKRDGTTTTRAR